MDDLKQAESYMRRAIELAKKGTGYTHPNPLVGAVIVKKGRIIGEGYHERYGELHAERNALKNCTEDPKGATIYVTLEPCCHHGKQPPCTDALIEAGISEVVVGSFDPNPLVSGKGFEILRNAGVKVTAGFLQEECDSINKAFFYYITKNLPYVTIKYAMTLDGKIASATGKSKWISCERSRKYVHSMRAENMAIMAGIGTVLADDPMLNVRDASGQDPIRVICDTHLRTPLSSKVVTTAWDEGFEEDQNGSSRDGAPYTVSGNAGGNYRKGFPRTIIATSVTDEDRLKPYRDAGVTILSIPEDSEGHVDMQVLMSKLGEMKIASLLVEGGASINWAVLKSGLASRAACFIAPMILGGKDARTPVEGSGQDSPSEAFRLVNGKVKAIGSDIFVEGDIEYR